MNIQPLSSRWFLCVAALLLLGIGILIGSGIPPRQEPPGENVVAAFAPASPLIEDEATPVSPAPVSPGPTLENWFALEVVPSPSPLEPPATPLSLGEETQPPTAAPTQETGFAIELVREGEETDLSAQGTAKRVLIYHTHTYEAYKQTEANPYRETEQWRTADAKHNVVRLGEELASLLRSMGIEVVHDTTAFEPPDYVTAYTRSLDMLEKRKSMGESYDLYLDMHRDAYIQSQPGPNAISVGDISVARLMMLVGKGEGQTAEGFGEKPQWQDNLLIAQRITDSLNSQVSGLGKDIRIKSGRFNQHISVGCLLVEVGNNQNTLEEALAAMPYLADALYQELQTTQK